ncbi:hypothetical protein LSCM1_03157 [Leishmania martiniquensis]|uniref:Haloacid dehalogenase-like hydrolase n=1 Tax=Leishmania martiniquensis TaxID=1580590 RepID=A0A836GUW6_9TRYP|nr:hypothetical protein LSCM1_03157 [Leishmania martiniquensis]
MDGTLLSPDHRVSAYTRKIIDKLQRERHVPFILATGRHHADVLATKQRIQLDGYLVTSNGARAHDPQGNIILKHDMGPKVARELARIALDWEDITTCIYQEDCWYVSRETDEMKEYHPENKGTFCPRLFDPESFDSYDGVYKVYYTSNNGPLLAALEHKIKDSYSDSVCVAYSLPNCMEVMAIGVNKGMALARVLKGFIFPKDPRSGEELLKACISFGDGENDVQMLIMAGTGYIMENAQDRLLSAVPFGKDPHLQMIGSNADDGVAKKLVEVFQLE